jgi:hypothetical protein
MHNETAPRPGTSLLPRPHSSAITWIDRRHALVARTMPSGAIDVTEIDVTETADGTPSNLIRVADAIGDRERVVITGSLGMRTALEREYVAIYQRPDRLVDVEPDAPLSRRELVERLRELAG